MLNLQNQPGIKGRERLQEQVVFAYEKAFKVINMSITAPTHLGDIY